MVTALLDVTEDGSFLPSHECSDVLFRLVAETRSERQFDPKFTNVTCPLWRKCQKLACPDL